MKKFNARVKRPSTQEEWKGETFDSIARRVWGRKAFVSLSADPNNSWGSMTQANVLIPAKYGGYNVIAQVLVWIEE